MAAQLQDAGEEVAALVLLDSSPVDGPATAEQRAGFAEQEEKVADALTGEEHEAYLRVVRNNTRILLAHRTRKTTGTLLLVSPPTPRRRRHGGATSSPARYGSTCSTAPTATCS